MVIMTELLVMEILDDRMKSEWCSIPPMGSSRMEVFLRAGEVKSLRVRKIIFFVTLVSYQE